MKAYGLILAAAVALAGCGTEQDAIAPSAAGHWTFELAATELHPACSGNVTLTETPFDASSIMGGVPGHAYIDGLFTCAGGVTGIFGGDRVDNSVMVALLVNNDTVWTRTAAELTATSMSGDGFRAQRE